MNAEERLLDRLDRLAVRMRRLAGEEDVPAFTVEEFGPIYVYTPQQGWTSDDEPINAGPISPTLLKLLERELPRVWERAWFALALFVAIAFVVGVLIWAAHS